MLYKTCLWLLWLSFAPNTYARHRFLPNAQDDIDDRSPLVNFQVKEPTLLSRDVPDCSLLLIQHNFANSWERPALANYTPPGSGDTPWAAVVLELNMTSRGTQYDRLGSVYLAHVRDSAHFDSRTDSVWHRMDSVSRVGCS